MIQRLLDSTTIPLLQQVARFSEQRHRALAGNIANIDTPNYRPRDLPVDDFRRALKDYVESGRDGGVVSAGQPGHGETIDRYFPEELFQPVLAPAENVTFQDGANRSIEAAVLEMVRNTGRQRFAIEVMASQFNLLQSVISERA